MITLAIVALIVLALMGWARAFRAANRLTTAHIRIVQLESRVLPDMPIYEQMRAANERNHERINSLLRALDETKEASA